MSSRKNNKREFPSWHPDFRINEDLPDIKAVRTEFLINIGSVGLALTLLFWIIYREASIYGLQNDLETLTSERQRLEPGNRGVVALNTRFSKRKQIVDDLEKFYDAPVNIPRFFGDLAKIRPENISFDEIAYQEVDEIKKDSYDRFYRIYLRGQTRNLRETNDLKESLDELPYLQDVEATITEGSNPRNPVLNTFGFSIQVLFQPGKEKKGS